MRTAVQVLLIVPTLAAGVIGQGRPDFSGTWVVVPSRSVWYDDGHPVNITVFGERFTAVQTEQTLRVVIENEGGFEWTYRLDGGVSHHAPPGPDGPQYRPAMAQADTQPTRFTIRAVEPTICR